MFRHELASEMDINAPSGRVWSILTDFAAYPSWNPFIRSIRGEPRLGARLEVRIQPSGARGMTFRPVITSLTPGAELAWRGRLLLPGIFDGIHRFALTQAGSVTQFRQGETFAGVLVPLLRASLDRYTLRGFHEMNQALKARAES